MVDASHGCIVHPYKDDRGIIVRVGQEAVNWWIGAMVAGVLIWLCTTILLAPAPVLTNTPAGNPARFAIRYLAATNDASAAATFERGRLRVFLQWQSEVIDVELIVFVHVLLDRFPSVRSIEMVGTTPIKPNEAVPLKKRLARLSIERVGRSAWVALAKVAY
jgi:hypothetical protein